MARIVTVYSDERHAARLTDMSYIRWYEISRALAERGHEVDIATAEFKWRPRQPTVNLGDNLRRVPLARIDWSRYDVVKTLFHRGFEVLRGRGGVDHPYIISKLGSVVGPEDMEGIYFYGERRARLYETQERIARRSRFVTLLTEPARALWTDMFGPDQDVLLVPGAVRREIPPPGDDPYPDDGRPRAVFAGNFYTTDARRSQPEAGRVLVDRLNALGRAVRRRGMRLYVVGPGEAALLDERYVTYLGVVEYDASWAYLHHADVGVLVSAGAFMHNNESTKIYHYLRAGLPFVSERGFPNDDLARRSGLALHVDPGDTEGMTDALEDAVVREWDRERGPAAVLGEHTWAHRAAVYDRLLSERPPGSRAGDAPAPPRA